MVKQKINEVEINGVKYYSAESIPASPSMSENLVLVRTYSAGVHFGELVSRKDKEVVLANTRRVHYWSGACSLSQMALEGVKNPTECRFSVVVPTITLTEAIEVIPLSEAAAKNLYDVPVWKS